MLKNFKVVVKVICKQIEQCEIFCLPILLFCNYDLHFALAQQIRECFAGNVVMFEKECVRFLPKWLQYFIVRQRHCL